VSKYGSSAVKDDSKRGFFAPPKPVVGMLLTRVFRIIKITLQCESKKSP